MKTAAYALYTICYVCGVGFTWNGSNFWEARSKTFNNDGDGVNDLYAIMDMSLLGMGLCATVILVAGFAIYWIRPRPDSK